MNQDIDDTEVVISNSKQHKEVFTPNLIISTLDEIPSQWSSFLTSFISSPTILTAAESLPYFPMILKASCYWLKRLTRDCCGRFQPYFEEIYEKFIAVGEILESHLQVPHVYLDADTFQNGDLLARHKCAALKLDESIKMLQDKREHVLEQLASLQTTEKEDPSNEDESFRFQFFGEDQEELRLKNAHVLHRLLDLGTCLYRLHVQFIMCLEIYQSYLSKVFKITKRLEVTVKILLKLVLYNVSA